MTPLLFFVHRCLLVICLLSCALLNFAQPDLGYVWGRAIMGTDFVNEGYSVVDAAGNVYIAGNFNQTADFDPGPNAVNLAAVGDMDAFICKLDPGGNYAWAIQLGSNSVDKAENVKLDALGNVYVTGSFSGTVDFDPGPGAALLSAAAGTDAFVAKYDNAGNYVWAVSFAESGNSTGMALSIDANTNVYATGNFSGDITFSSSIFYTSLGANDSYICKLNSNGAVVWAKRVGGDGEDRGWGIAADVMGNVFVTGDFTGSGDFDPGPGSTIFTTVFSNVWLVKLDAGGNLVWAIHNGARAALDLKTDAAGNLYLVGSFMGTVDFDPGPNTATLYTPYRSTQYLWKLTNDGGYVFAKDYVFANSSVALDAIGNIYTSGGNAVFSKRDQNGNGGWNYSYNAGGLAHCNTIAVDATLHVYTIGIFNVPIDLDPSAGMAVFTPTGTRAIWINKLTQPEAGPLPLTWIKLEGHLNNQHQATISFTVSEEDVQGYTVEKSTDGITYSKIGALESNGNGTHSYVYTEPIALQQTAWYRILQTDANGQFSYSANVRIVASQARSAATVFPIPAKGHVTLQITGDELLHTKAILIDMKGRPVKTVLINNYSTAISLHNLPGGLYLLQLANGSSLKIMRQE